MIGLKPHEQTVLEFFRDCKKKGLLRNTPVKPAIAIGATIRADVSILTDQAIEKIRGYMAVQKNNQEPLLTEKEYDALQFSRNINFLRDSIEELKISLQLIFDPSKIKPNTELGTYLVQIYEKLDYDNDKQIKINEAFQKDLRNALSHQDYWYTQNEIHIESIVWRDKDKTTEWTQQELSKSISKIININTMVSKILDGSF